MSQVMREVGQLEASIGTSIADVMAKQQAKDRLDHLMTHCVVSRVHGRARSEPVRARPMMPGWRLLGRSRIPVYCRSAAPASDRFVGTWRGGVAVGPHVS